MALNERKRGFALLIAVIFMSVMLTFGLALASLAYKQSVLASSTVASGDAFYAADGALECALYADQQEALFAYPGTEPSSAPVMDCDGNAASYPPATPTGIVSYDASGWVVTERLSLDSGSECADITVYKPVTGRTYVFSQGYAVSCDVVANPGFARVVTRGLVAGY